MTKRHYFVVYGVVQGVGFRYFTRHRASEYGLTGWCRNTPTDTVEGEIQGPEEILTQFFKDINMGPRGSRVDKLETEARETLQDEKHFEIRR